MSFDSGSHSNQMAIGEKMLRKYVLKHFNDTMENQYNEDDYSEVVKEAKKEVEEYITECGDINNISGDNYYRFADESWITVTYIGNNPMKVFTDLVIASQKLEKKKIKKV